MMPQTWFKNKLCNRLLKLFLPRDAMHKSGHAVMRYPSVCQFVCLTATFVDSVETNQHIFHTFHYRISTPSSFVTPNVMAIFRLAEPLTGRRMQVEWEKIAILDEYLAIGSTIAVRRSTTATVDGAVYCTDGHTSVSLVYYNQHGRPRRR